jgi:WD40 repeat protein
MDGHIIFYNLIDKVKLRSLDADHNKGVKKLSYTSGFSGNLVSIGCEIYASVWAPEALVDEVLLGRLKGHTRPILATKFIGTTPFNVTLDEDNNIRIWDIRI